MNQYSKNKIFALSLGFSIIAVLFSLFVEYGLSIKPCSLCKWQRWVFISISGGSLLGFLLNRKREMLGLVLICFVGLFLLSSYHGLVQYGVISDPCIVPKISSADDFWKMINAPLPCSKISFSIFGIPISVFNSIFSLAFVIYIVRMSLYSKRHGSIQEDQMFNILNKKDVEE